MPPPQQGGASWGGFFCSSVASIGAEVVTFPLDSVKVQLQVGSAAGAATSGSKYAMVHRLVREKGFRGALYPGISPALARQVLYGGISLNSYQSIRDFIIGDADEKSYSFFKRFIAGSSGSMLGQLVAVPFDVAKVRLQADTRSSVSRYQGRSLGFVFKDIVNTGGVSALWRGAGTSVARAAALNGTWMATYDTSKQAIIRSSGLGDGRVTYALASLLSSTAACLAASPFDVIKTRLMQSSSKQNMIESYRGFWDCAIRSAKADGLLVFYRGLLPSIARSSPWSFVFWQLYEPLCKLVMGRSF